MAQYEKPHLNYNEQVEKLVDRGLSIASVPEAVAALKRIGYYRLSAYTYPFRRPGLGDERRRSEFVEGATLEDALMLYDFDEKLRTVLLSGLQQLEIGLRVQIAYNLGKRHMFAHLEREQLNESACSVIRPEEDADAYSRWLDAHYRQQSAAKQEDYVKHFIVNYEGKLPIWVATEFMSFGQLTKLYDFLPDKEAKVIAKNLGVSVGRDVLSSWLRALNSQRNHCAHNARIWNRATVYPPKRLPERVSPPIIKHLATTDNRRVYYLAALTAYMLLKIDPATRWPSQFRTVMHKYKVVSDMTPQNTMGFPDEWSSLQLWDHRKDA